ncbi:MAG TPA: hypothetical protein VKD72_21765 [Gemmataceae bacterium]|nr:hypothetical protein [Gemmataceae bacterium]
MRDERSAVRWYDPVIVRGFQVARCLSERKVAEFMYTTWQRGYDDLGAHGLTMRGKD